MRRPTTFRAFLLFLSISTLLFSSFIVSVAAAAEGGTVSSSDSGWVEQTPDPEGEDLISLSAVDADTAWAVGNNTTLKTADGGATWTTQVSQNAYNWSVCAVNADHAWAMGGIDDYAYDNVEKTANGGLNWVRLNTGLDAGAYIVDIAALDVNTIWAVGSGETIIRTDNGGWTWTLQNYITPIMDEWLMGISAADASTAWAVGSYGTILKTTDAGVTWSEQDAGYNLFSGVAAVDTQTAWIVGAGANIYKTTDGGATWVLQDSGAADSLSAISAVDASTAWAVGTWNMAGPSGEASVILKTTDGGDTWVQQDSTTEAPLYDICAVDVTTAWAVGKDGTILKTVDGGDALPDIVSVVPTSGGEGDAVTVSGCDFGETQDSSYVSFGDTRATAYTSWSDTEIVAEVPSGVEGEMEVTVTTSEGTSNPKSFTAYGPLSLTSITPDTAAQNTITVQITDLAGTGFQPGAQVRFEQGDTVLAAYDVSVVSGESITCKIGFFLTPTGAWDVVVTNPDGAEACLEDGFTVTSNCGQGSGTALLMLGLTLGLLSTAGSARLRRRRK
ncbi:MAG: IPT/TIG domain-containing protein [Actinobacteria bacterium]|nr:IPT/TIG domain-containing protein [Actinomycetota bacterium]